jgi:hypothetical protein
MHRQGQAILSLESQHMHRQGQAVFRLGSQHMHRQGQAVFRLGAQVRNTCMDRDRLFLG